MTQFAPYKRSLGPWGWLALLLVWGPAVNAAPPAPELEVADGGATAGFYRLVWRWPGEGQARFELQEASTRSFEDPTLVYRGPDQASTLTGRQDGTYYYRVRARRGGQTSPWSSVGEVTVAHHPLSRAFGFFVSGGVVFLATLALIVTGTRRAARQQ